MSARRAAAAFAALLLAPVAAHGQASPSAFTSATRYDAAGRTTGTIAPDPDGDGALHHAAVRNSYDAAGRLIRQETGELAAWQSESVAPASWANFTVFRTLETGYDAMGRKSRDSLREESAGTVRTLTQYSYDAAGRLECTAVRMNPAVFGSLPSSACTPGTQGSAPNDYGPDRITRTVYDAGNQRIQLREGVGTGDEGTEASWAYNVNGQIVAVIDGNGNRAELHYDGHGRQDRWSFPSATRPGSYNDATHATALASAGTVNASDYEAYSYDPNGNRTSLRKRDGSTLTYSYDALNRVTVKFVPERPSGPQALTANQTRDVYYAYDLRNLQLAARFDSPSGEGIVSAYDGFGRLISTATSMDGTTRTLAYQYDPNGSRTQITHPDGQFFTFDIDGLNRFAGINESGISDVLSQYYNAMGQRYVLGGGGTATGALYDPLGRLTYLVTDLGGGAGTVSTFGHNPAWQIVGQTRTNDAYAWTGAYTVARPYTANGLNQYSAAGAASFTYEGNGSLAGDGSDSYVYDIENRLVSASGGHNAVLRYDPLGRLYEVTGASGTTRFLYDGDALVAEYNNTGTLLRRYVHGGGVDAPLLWYEGADVAFPNRRSLMADHQGSIIVVADYQGNPLSTNTYDEYGIPGAANTGRFQYTGQIWLPELGMYHYKARVYSPTLGRFLQADPVGYEDQFNLYAYVGNDPVNRTDPTGTTCEERRNGTYCRINRFYLFGIFPIQRENLTAYYRNQVRKFETNYTRAYIAMRDQNRTVTVGATGGRANTSFQVSTGDVAASLAGRQVRYNMGLDSGNTLLSTGGNPNRVGYSGINMQVYERGINATARDIVHDGIHSTRAEYDGNYFAVVLGEEPYATEHQDPYNVGAARLCGRLC